MRNQRYDMSSGRGKHWMEIYGGWSAPDTAHTPFVKSIVEDWPATAPLEVYADRLEEWADPRADVVRAASDACVWAAGLTNNIRALRRIGHVVDLLHPSRGPGEDLAFASLLTYAPPDTGREGERVGELCPPLGRAMLAVSVLRACGVLGEAEALDLNCVYNLRQMWYAPRGPCGRASALAAEISACLPCPNRTAMAASRLWRPTYSLGHYSAAAWWVEQLYFQSFGGVVTEYLRLADFAREDVVPERLNLGWLRQLVKPAKRSRKEMAHAS